MGINRLDFIAYFMCHFCILISGYYGDGFINVITDPDGSYNITLFNTTWLHSAPTFFIINGTRYSTEDGSLELMSINTTREGVPILGGWVSIDFYYNAGDVSIVTSFIYQCGLSFKVRFVDGASNTDQPNLDGVICGFPGFRMDSEEELGFMSFRGENLGFEKQAVGRWNHDADIQDGLEGSSPLTLFDQKRNTLTIGSMDNFMSTVMWRDNVNNFLYWGIMGGVDEVPSNFSYEVLAAAAYAGNVNSFISWGYVVGASFDLFRRPADSTLMKMGYWTDEGSYYFDQTAQGTSNYEDTLLRVFSDARNNSINYSYVEWDTWWFKKGAGGGVKEWTSPTDVFPHGEMSSDTIYAKQNGGKFSFEIEGDMALPLEEAFWDFIFEESKKWGLVTYIQDNMTDIFRNFPRMKTDINFARDWLMSMAKSAQRHNVSIQYSGALPRMAMETMELPAVTQIRGSPSYAFSLNQWKIGLATIFGDSLLLAVFKDVFLTKGSKSPERESLVSVLSSGPVAIGDGIGNTNSSIVNRMCTSDGSILRALVPAKTIYPQIQELAFQNGGPDGQVWVTWSDINSVNGISTLRLGIIFVSGLTRPFAITPNNTGLDVYIQFQESKIFSSRNPRLQYDFSNTKPFELPPCTNTDYCLYYTSTVISLFEEDVLILGELDKWIPISKTRIQNLTVSFNTIAIVVKGQPKELVKFSFSSNGDVISLNTVINDSGFATLVYKTKPSPANSVGHWHSIDSVIGLALCVIVSTLFIHWTKML